MFHCLNNLLFYILFSIIVIDSIQFNSFQFRYRDGARKRAKSDEKQNTNNLFSRLKLFKRKKNPNNANRYGK